VALKRAVGLWSLQKLLGASVFGHGFGTLRYSVFCQFSWKNQPYSSLHLTASYCGSLVVVSKSWCFTCNSFEDIIDEAVHDAHSFARHTSVGVHLLQHLVDVDTIAFFSFPLLFLITSASCFSLSCFLGTFGANFGRHIDVLVKIYAECTLQLLRVFIFNKICKLDSSTRFIGQQKSSNLHSCNRRDFFNELH